MKVEELKVCKDHKNHGNINDDNGSDDNGNDGCNFANNLNFFNNSCNDDTINNEQYW